MYKHLHFRYFSDGCTTLYKQNPDFLSKFGSTEVEEKLKSGLEFILKGALDNRNAGHVVNCSAVNCSTHRCSLTKLLTF